MNKMLKSKEQLLKEAKGFRLQIKICAIILLVISIIVCIFRPSSILSNEFIIVPVVDIILFGIFIRMNTIISEYEKILKDKISQDTSKKTNYVNKDK